ncbi:MAG: Fic family protein [Candidatus Azambacteria bacterium]|nr:Fic family protein [Candidatus Azambacteria bacterium]
MKQKKLSSKQPQEVLDLLSEYSKALSILEQYDAGTLTKPKGAKAKFVLKYEDCTKIIKNVRLELIGKEGAGSLFGSERGGMFEGIIKNLYQTFNKKELYNTVDEKAAHLLYLIVKDHPFSDGNKRLGAFLFVYFLNKNNYLRKKGGERKIDNNTLVALTLLTAESNPKEKDVIVKIILNLIVD